MQKDFEEFAAKRCEKAMGECAEYQELQLKCITAYNAGDIELYSELSNQLQAIVEIESYKRCFKDFWSQICTPNFKIM